MGRKYRQPPIIEALCEIQFGADSPWDAAIPGLIYASIQDQYPIRRPMRVMSVDIIEQPASQAEPITQLQASERTQFLASDEKTLVQVGTRLLTVNRLAPYTSWEEFLPCIMQGFEAYIAASHATAIQRIALRYINRIVLPGMAVELPDYFEFRPYVGPKLPQDYFTFAAGMQVFYEPAEVLRIELLSIASETPGTMAAILDFNYVLVQSGSIDLATVPAWLTTAHQRIEEAFEASITDKLRAQFDAEDRL